MLNAQCSIFQLVEALVDKSLLRQREDPNGDARFVMLETIREYALERLEASGKAELFASGMPPIIKSWGNTCG